MVRARESAAVGFRVKTYFTPLVAGALLITGSAAARAADLPAVVPAPGVHPGEITVGSVLDLSGPLSAEGIAIKSGLTLAFEEINRQGGILGRQIHLIVKDSGYNPVKAQAGADALLHRGIFALLCPNGTPPVSAIADMVLNRGVLLLFPFASSPEDSPLSDRLQFDMELPVPAQIETGLKVLLDRRGALRVGVLYRDDAFGRAALDGAALELTRRGLAPAVAAAYKPGAQDFSAQIESLRQAGAELVVLGAVAQESFSAMASAHSRRWYPVFLCPSDCYVPEAATLAGLAPEGLYAVAATPIPYRDTRDPALDAWARRFESRFHTVASAQAFRAYLDGRLFAEALRRSGKFPTPLHFARVLENMPPWTDPVYGGIAVDYNSRDHLGLHTGFLAQFARGRWHVSKPPRETFAR